MATTGIMNGTLLRLYADQAGGTSFTVIGTSTDVTLNLSHSPRETTNQDSAGHADFLEGKRVKSIDATFFYSVDGTNDFDAWYATFDSETLRGFVTAKVASTAQGDSTYTYDGYITGLTLNSGGPENNASCTVSIQVTGKGATGTVA